MFGAKALVGLMLCGLASVVGAQVKPQDGDITTQGYCEYCFPEDPPPSPPAYEATFVGQTVPATMLAGQSYAVSVQMKNAGSYTWTAAENYRLGSQNPHDNVTWGLHRVNVPSNTPNGYTATFNFTVTAPVTPGSYNFQWKMLREGVTWFGGTSSNVVVSVIAATGTISASPNPCTFAVGGSTCTSTISWNSNAANAEVWVTGLDGSNPALFARAQSGTASAPWITAAGGRFLLKSGSSVLATVDVRGNPPPNATPSVALTSPANGQTFLSGASINLAANASDSDGSIQRVEFWIDGSKVGEDTTSPYTSSWSATAGTHSITAKAFDNLSAVSTSAAISISASDSVITGVVDGIVTDAQGNYSLRGWACSTHLNTSVAVHVYVNGGWPSGTEVASATANLPSESAVASTCQASGSNYRFSIPLTLTLRQQYSGMGLYVHGISPTGGNNNLLARSGTYAMPSPVPSPPVNAMLTRHYVYDANQQLCKTIEPETGATVMHYDAAGNLDWSAAGLPISSFGSTTSCDTDAAYASGRRVDRSYDARNRPKSLIFPDHNGDQTWEYTPDGLPSLVTTNNNSNLVTNAYSYNRRRMLVGESLQHATLPAWSIGYGYNPNGHLERIQHPGSELIEYAPNALGQPTQVVSTYGSYATGVSYYPNGAIAQFTYGNGIVHTLHQNTRQLPDRSKDVYGTSVPVLDDSYTYDFNGNVAAISDGVSGRGNRTMTYDNLDRLKTAVSPMFGSGGASYKYDVLDNLIELKAPAQNRQHYYWYEPGTNRLINVQNELGATVVGLGYDAQGNLENKSGTHFIFDYGNRLRQATYGNGEVESYRYDAYGRRVFATTPNATGNIIYSQYDQTGVLRYQRNERKQSVLNYIYLGGSLVAIRETPLNTGNHVVTYQHTDALGTPVAVTDANRVVIDRNEYEPYGQLLNEQITDGVGFTGHVMDAQTKLTYMQQRYYDPMIGRFLSVDPVTVTSVGGNFNRYWYANNNPYRFTDPDGRRAKSQGPCGFCNYSVAGSPGREEDSGDDGDDGADGSKASNEQTVNSYSDLPPLPDGTGYFDEHGNWVYSGQDWMRVEIPTGNEEVRYASLTEQSSSINAPLGDFVSLPAKTPVGMVVARAAEAMLPTILGGTVRGSTWKEYRLGYQQIMYHQPANGPVTRSPMYEHGLIWTRETIWRRTPDYQQKMDWRICWQCD